MKTSALQKIPLRKGKEKPSFEIKIFVNCISDKGLVSSLYKELLEPNNMTNNQLKIGKRNIK
jgi:hypothetical protein